MDSLTFGSFVRLEFNKQNFTDITARHGKLIIKQKALPISLMSLNLKYIYTKLILIKNIKTYFHYATKMNEKFNVYSNIKPIIMELGNFTTPLGQLFSYQLP